MPGPPNPDPRLEHVRMGHGSYGVTPAHVWGATQSAPVVIGNYCSVAATAYFLCHMEHPLATPSTFPFKTLLWQEPPMLGGLNADAITRGPITLGHDVWVAHGAIILSGVTIGTGAVVGAGAVVRKDVPPYAIAAGNPARVVRSRFPPDVVEKLLASQWWTLKPEDLRPLRDHLYSEDVPTFLAAVSRLKGRSQTPPEASAIPQ